MLLVRKIVYVSYNIFSIFTLKCMNWNDEQKRSSVLGYKLSEHENCET